MAVYDTMRQLNAVFSTMVSFFNILSENEVCAKLLANGTFGVPKLAGKVR